MWGYCIGAASLGIKHRVLDGFQFEGGSIGNRERRLEWPTPAAPVGPERGYYLFHYTYGVEYSREGLPMELQVGEWSLDKRHYMGGPPPRALAPPPKCAHDRAFVLRGLYNNASATLPWKGGGGAGAHWDASRTRSGRRTACCSPFSFPLQGSTPSRACRCATSGRRKIR